MLLALPWRKYSCHDFVVNGKQIKMIELTNDDRGTGLIVWDGAFVLSKYLERHQSVLRGTSVIELGCGTGLCGISSSILGATTVYLTDLEYVLDNLKANLEINKWDTQGLIVCHELDWYRPSFEFFEGNKPQVILMADVAWIIELIRPLVMTLRKLCDFCSPILPKILIAHQTRSLKSDQVLFDSLHEFGFKIVQIDKNQLDPDYNGVNLYEISQ